MRYDIIVRLAVNGHPRYRMNHNREPLRAEAAQRAFDAACSEQWERLAPSGTPPHWHHIGNVVGMEADTGDGRRRVTVSIEPRG